MAKKSIIVSDLSGEVISENEHAQVRILLPRGRKDVLLDVKRAEVDELVKAGREVARRGRPASS